MRATVVVLALLFASAAARPAGARQPLTVNIFKLKNADAEKLRPTIATIFGGQRLTVTVDARTNSLVVAADKDTLEEIRKLVEELDKPLKPKK